MARYPFSCARSVISILEELPIIFAAAVAAGAMIMHYNEWSAPY